MSLNVQEIYNVLFEFESNGKLKREEIKAYPIHKKLIFNNQNIDDISDWIIINLNIEGKDHILDAGCGVGFTLLKICNTLNCSGLGISLSNKEVEYAIRIAEEYDLSKICSFECISFDDHLNRRFDLIIAIESIKHTNFLNNTIENLVKHLNTNGRIFILDDFIVRRKFLFLENQVKKYWSVKSFFTLQNIEDKISDLRLEYEIVDFTPKVTFARNKFTTIKVLLLYLSLYLVKPFKIHKLLSIYFAGLCLELLYCRGALEYKAILARKVN